MDNIEELKSQLTRKTQECEELKREIAFGNNGALSDKIRAEVFKELNNENDQLKQTLTEIKEIAEKAKKDICNNCAWRNTDSCDPEYYTCGDFIKILQKIKEVV